MITLPEPGYGVIGPPAYGVYGGGGGGVGATADGYAPGGNTGYGIWWWWWWTCGTIIGAVGGINPGAVTAPAWSPSRPINCILVSPSIDINWIRWIGIRWENWQKCMPLIATFLIIINNKKEKIIIMIVNFQLKTK